MLRNLVLQILGKERVENKTKVKVIDEKKYRFFKFKPLHNKNKDEITVIVSKDLKLSDFQKEVKWFIENNSEDLAYLKMVWNKNFPEQIWR